MSVITTLPNIGICGHLRSGKDLAGAYLAERYGYTRFAFGDEMKRLAHEIFDDTPAYPKPRELYQWFGETMRQRDPDVWVRKCLEEIRAYTEAFGLGAFIPGSAPPAVITDLRLPTEFSTLRSAGYVIIRIAAPEALRIQRAITASDTFNLRDLTHQTESHIDSFAVDYEIENSATPADLYAQIDAIIGELKLT
ncbi:adenylate kinase [Paenibacillus humicus]|uniref:adenylate kinase n=1 Tax=Paenibacillus humicus TaxID=412861 RepID=UPI001FE64E7E|nr:adenylate kinase [Paenibacillus humicus]